MSRQCVTQDNLRLDIVLELALMHGLDRTRRADGHEDGGLNRTVGGFDPPGAGLGILILGFEKKLHSL